MGIPFWPANACRQGRYVPGFTAVQPAPLQGLSGALHRPSTSLCRKIFIHRNYLFPPPLPFFHSYPLPFTPFHSSILPFHSSPFHSSILPFFHSPPLPFFHSSILPFFPSILPPFFHSSSILPPFHSSSPSHCLHRLEAPDLPNGKSGQ
jgi:hypothetical protein